MDNLVWPGRHRRYSGDPLTLVRRVIQRARESVGGSEEDLARILQAALPGRTIIGAIVAAWESGPTPPPGDVLAVALGLLGCNLVLELTDEPAGLPLHAAQVGIPSGGHVAGQLVVSGIDAARLQAAATNGRGVGRRIVQDLAILTEEYWCLYHRMAPKSLQPVVAAHHDLMKRLLVNSSPGPHRPQLAAALGQAAMLDGWLSFLLDDRHTARDRWVYAEQLAEEFGDGQLRAHVLIARSSLVSSLPQGGRSGESAVAITLLDEAERLVGESAPLRAWLLARRAEEHAAGGRRSSAAARACARDLATAERLLTGKGASGCLPGPKTELDWNGFRGNCALMLGRDDEAVQVLRASLAAAPLDRATLRAVLLNDYGAALARLGQVDEACAAFTESLGLADETGAAVHAQRVAGGARHLERWRQAPVVAELLDRLARLA